MVHRTLFLVSAVFLSVSLLIFVLSRCTADFLPTALVGPSGMELHLRCLMPVRWEDVLNAMGTRP